MGIEINLTLDEIEGRVIYWETKHKEIGAVYSNAPRLANGLVIEEIRLSPDYRANKRLQNEAFSQLRFWNTIAVKARKLQKKV